MAETRVLFKVRGDGKALRSAASRAFGAGSVEVDSILSVPARPAGRGMGKTAAATWLRVTVDKNVSENLWDAAHAMVTQGGPYAMAVSGIEAVEPDIVQKWPQEQDPETEGQGLAGASDRCAFSGQDEKGGKQKGPGNAWSFDDDFSELKKARKRVLNGSPEALAKIVVAHLDTGYDPGHVTLPANLDLKKQKNFVAGDGKPDDATDRTPPGEEYIRDRGHGTATLALLAGNKLDGKSPSWPGFKDYLGGAPLATVIPIRIADWVVRFSTSTMVQGIDHARRSGAHVLSMSMGGMTSAALVDAVNLAYDDGVFMVMAAGNNFAYVPSPKSVVFPARYRRVLAACGVMANGRAYAGLRPGTMQGNYGPASKMNTALGAYTPNVPWAQIDCAKAVSMDGAGTSSATPQIAAAVALWLAEHWATVKKYPEPWMRVEAARHALFSAAAKSTASMNAAETLEKIGQGVMKAAAALQVAPLTKDKLTRLPLAEASWGWTDLIFGDGVSAAPGKNPVREKMLMLELTQLVRHVPEVEAAIADNDEPADKISAAAKNRYLEAALDSGRASKTLREALEKVLGRQAAKRPNLPVKRKPILPSVPPARRLRVYALDPSIAQNFDTAAVNETRLAVRWEKGLEPGPVGEYLEVVDIDPASDRFHDPVDLNKVELLAQDGWTPSEGNPQFHQQMVYAVGMTVIEEFERALGRKALWATRRVKGEDGSGGVGLKELEVPRLRIYPHALREDNAYYSPEKVALLFGYFQAMSKQGDTTVPGSMVFTCLSSDIIAHEMSHALLDGLHRRFQEASNPDVPAFHEAFADIVALFRHFRIEELVRFEIAGARGAGLSAAKLLGGVARQFGEGRGDSGPLRDYLGSAIDSLSYASTFETHPRGSILVDAIYDAFLRIVDRRTEDLIRIATNGTGLLPQGALHPDLVNRLTTETCKAAEHVLRMCIRALDYIPAVDITFGEYLRAIITADRDLVPDDKFKYRTAFMEAFRKRDLLPRNVRTVSEETLRWQAPDYPPVNPDHPPDQPNDAHKELVKRLIGGLDPTWDRNIDRSKVFALSEENRRKMWSNLKAEFAREAKEPDAEPKLMDALGLESGLPLYGQDGKEIPGTPTGETTFDVYGVRPVRRVAPDGSFLTEVLATILQRRPLDISGDDVAGEVSWFRGGATLIIDPRPGHEAIRYIILKRLGSETRKTIHRDTALRGLLSPLRALYFGKVPGEPFAIMHSDRERSRHG